MSTSAVAAATVQIRALQPADLDAVVAIDAAIEGRTRRDYIERRLRSAQKQPLLHAQFAAMQGDQLVGYLLGRLASGEFGRRAPALRIELVGLRPEHSRRGVGRALFDALLRGGGRHGASELRTLSNWTRSDMLGWLAQGMTVAEIVADYPELEPEDVSACLTFAAERERGTVTVHAA